MLAVCALRCFQKSLVAKESPLWGEMVSEQNVEFISMGRLILEIYLWTPNCGLGTLWF